jgi:uncharacterized membrane protein
MTRATRILALALSASLALNVFFLGFGVARFMTKGPARREDSFERPGDLGAPMRGMWKGHAGVLQPRREAVDAARRAVREALVAEPFQAEALESALATLRNDRGEAAAAMHRALVERARQLSPEERRQVAASRWFLGLPPRGGSRGH